MVRKATTKKTKNKTKKKTKKVIKLKLTEKQIIDNANEKAVNHLARKVLSWKWNKKRECWVTAGKQDIHKFVPHIDRNHCEWLLSMCPRYSIDKYNEQEIAVRVETVNGLWSFAVAPTECQAICKAFLAVTEYKG